MPDDETTREQEPDSTTTEAGILDRLTGEDDQRPWSVDELIRDVGYRLPALDAINSLHHSGLIHRTKDDLIYPTRTAVRAKELEI